MITPSHHHLLLVRHSQPEIMLGLPARDWRLSAEGRARCQLLAEEIARIDGRRAATRCKKTGAAILGGVENMAYFPDPATGARIPIFGTGGAAKEAEALGVPLLAEIPIEVALREACDQGRPIVATTPESASAQAFLKMAQALA